VVQSFPDDLAFDEVETAEGDLQEQDRVDHQPDHALSMRAQPPSQRAAKGSPRDKVGSLGGYAAVGSTV
jgi:hypothetical protein